MSAPVTSAFVGKNFFRSSVSFGHPNVENGHNADENQVSSTSVSSVKFTSFPNFSRACTFASSRLFATKTVPSSA